MVIIYQLPTINLQPPFSMYFVFHYDNDVPFVSIEQEYHEYNPKEIRSATEMCFAFVITHDLMPSFWIGKKGTEINHTRMILY
jgi:hypothetical protein